MFMAEHALHSLPKCLWLNTLYTRSLNVDDWAHFANTIQTGCPICSYDGHGEVHISSCRKMLEHLHGVIYLCSQVIQFLHEIRNGHLWELQHYYILNKFTAIYYSQSSV